MNANLPPKIIREFIAPYDIVSVQPVTPGFSGAVVYRCRSASGKAFALKRWPSETQAERVQAVHRVQSCARQSGCSFVPQLMPAKCNALGSVSDLEVNGACWELADWMSGTPLPPDASLSSIQAGAAAIAQFHDAVCQLTDRTRSPPPAVINRLQRVRELQSLLPRALTADTGSQAAAPLSETLAAAAELLYGTWGTVSQRIIDSLHRHAAHEVTVQYVLRDIHREHLLFSGDAVTGLIDFDAVRVDTPATDLVRWGGSFLIGREDPDAVWEATMAGFCRSSPFQDEEDRLQFSILIRDLHYSSTWISLANWAVWLRVESRTFPAGYEAIRARIDDLCWKARQLL